MGAGFLGANTRAGTGMTLPGLLAAGTLYLAGTASVWRYLHPGGVFGPEIAASRRAFLRNLAVTAGSLSLGIGGYRWLVGRLEPPAVASVQSSEVARTAATVAAASTLEEALALGVPGLAPEITPNDAFYVVSKNFLQDPTVDAAKWRLEVVGSVDRPMTLTYDDMKALTSASQYFTLQCISNAVGGDLIGNAHWRGAPLADVLRNAGTHPTAVDVILHAADGYTDSIPLAKAMQPDAMLAYEMNGAVLPHVHGFPVRLLVPDLYGMKNVKWITKIEVVDYDYKGYWMQRGWTDESIMHTTSRIDVPRNSSFLRPGPNYVGGVAVAGQRGIQRVEVSTDGGRIWNDATLKAALGPNAWSLWLFAWEMADGSAASEQTILVRATDGTGTLQIPTVHEPVPEGATGYHAILVKQATG
jgi:DMSO/TMAO reductase YedYZ molybdopterin-dependent catalytic subunit